MLAADTPDAQALHPLARLLAARYAEAAEQLKAAGRFYECFETPVELDLKRKELERREAQLRKDDEARRAAMSRPAAPAAAAPAPAPAPAAPAGGRPPVKAADGF